jgi:hypothetical protein
LPPDAARLHAILRHLDAAIAENEVVHTYLDLQRGRVLAALRAVEGPESSFEPPHAVREEYRRPDAGGLGTGFKLDRARTPDGPVATSVHLDDCKMISGLARPLTTEEARAALVTEQLEACGFCRPDTELGIDIDA